MADQPQQRSGTSESHRKGRRRLLQALAAAGGAFGAATLLPTRWTKPVVDSIIIPLHAQGSPIDGLFSTATIPTFSMIDRIVPPLHAAPAGGNVVVGNASFDLGWDIGNTSYAICGTGITTTMSSTQPFVVDGGGLRSGNQLENYAQNIPGGTLQILNQQIGACGLTFDALYQSGKTFVTALPGTGCDFLNNTVAMQSSSPYPDEESS